MPLTQRTRTWLGIVCLTLSLAGCITIALGATVVGAVGLAAAALAGAAGWWAPSGEAPSPLDETQYAIARMSHEVRTPLTSIIGILDLLDGTDAAVDDEERPELLDLARAEARHMEHLIENLHSAARLARTGLDPDPKPIAIAALVARVVDRFPSVARRTYLPSGDLRALADEQLTAQIITNLVQNLQRYAPEGEVTISAERRGHEVAVLFSDDGPGIVDASRVFDRSSSGHGLGIGLPLSRELAEAMGGRLQIEPPRRRGTTFALTLPHTDRTNGLRPQGPEQRTGRVIAHAPRARLLIDLAAALAERSLDRTMAGIHRLYVELLGATGTVLMVPYEGAFQPISAAGTTNVPKVVDATLSHVLRTGSTVELTGISNPGVPKWQAELDGRAALAFPVIDGADVVGVMVVAFAHANDLPANRAGQVAQALAQLAAFAIHRSALARDVAFERTLRSTVMEALPIAISVFAGDPPTVVDWNQREREMLGLTDNSVRPADLDSTQHLFDVRFSDGTPLTVDNAPVTAAIRTGETTGPFLLNIRRLDGSEICTRTYCAPFFGEDGKVAGAVVTSEEVGVAETNTAATGRATTPPLPRPA